MGTDAQTGSGWVTAPTIFLWIAYLPAKILNMIGVPDYLSILVVSILLTVMFIRFRKVKFLQDPQIVFTLIFLAGEIAFSALVEVNLGTSFRHRSIPLVPLVFLYV